MRLVATGFSAPRRPRCARQLVRIMMPFLPAISLAVVAMGALNAEEQYTAPALASSMFNLVAIVGGRVVYAIAPSARTAVMAWAALTLVGGVAQLAIQVPPLWRTGFRPAPAARSRAARSGTRRIAALMAPATLGVAAVQINVVINSSFASLVSDGAISWLSYAFRLMQLPIGVFGVAVGTTVAHPPVARRRRPGLGRLRATLRRGLRMVLFLTVPSTVGLALLGVPIIRLIYQHGRFSPARHRRDRARPVRLRRGPGRLRGDQGGGAGVLRARPHARPAHRQRQRGGGEPGSGTSLTFRRFGHVGLALGTSIAALVNLAVLVLAFEHQVRGLLTRDLLIPVLRILAASAVMAAAVWALTSRMEMLPGEGPPCTPRRRSSPCSPALVV